jgi:predicted GNAT family acetyltransferase|tara:strand:+ start:752 stop:1096 length:345 start_codon:yes stop_codon:yes gene_type:complete
MDINIIGFRLPTATPDPARHSSCGWVAICDKKEVGWCNMSFLPDNVIKFEDAYVNPKYRGNGIYKMLWERRLNYVNAQFGSYTLIAYCKPSTLEFYKKQGFIEKEVITLMKKPA